MTVVMSCSVLCSVSVICT